MPCENQSICNELSSVIQGEGGDRNQLGIVQLTTFDEAKRIPVLLAVGYREERHGPIFPFRVCPFCAGALPVYPKP